MDKNASIPIIYIKELETDYVPYYLHNDCCSIDMNILIFQ